LKILVISDSHGDESSLEMILQKEQDCDMIIHLGDGINDMGPLIRYTVGKPVYLIRGNNDFGPDITDQQVIKAQDVTIFACHGHRLYVKYGLEKLYLQGLKENARLCLYGHTHYQALEEFNDVTLMNPGAAANKKYAVVQVEREAFTVLLKSL
jgi:hypothetical protein